MFSAFDTNKNLVYILIRRFSSFKLVNIKRRTYHTNFLWILRTYLLSKILKNKATALETQLRYIEMYLEHYGAYSRTVEIVRKHDTVMKNVVKILYILMSFWPWFWPNIGISYSKSPIMRTRKSLECKRKPWRIKFQQNVPLAAVKTLYSSLSFDPEIGSL